MWLYGVAWVINYSFRQAAWDSDLQCLSFLRFTAGMCRLIVSQQQCDVVWWAPTRFTRELFSSSNPSPHPVHWQTRKGEAVTAVSKRWTEPTSGRLHTLVERMTAALWSLKPLKTRGVRNERDLMWVNPFFHWDTLAYFLFIKWVFNLVFRLTTRET